MKVIHAAATLADTAAGPTHGLVLRVDGQRAVDAVDILRSDSKRLFARGNGAHSVTLQTTREFATHREAQVAYLTTFSYSAAAGVLEIQCGEHGETSQSVFAAQAILVALTPALVGKAVVLTYAWQTSLFTTSAPPDYIPGGETVVHANAYDIPSGAESLVVVFDPPFPGDGDVIVMLTVGVPDGQPLVFADLQQSTVSPDGFSVLLSAPVPDTDYVLNCTAVQKPS